MKREYLILKGAFSVSLMVLALGIAVNLRISGMNSFGKTQVADIVALSTPIQTTQNWMPRGNGDRASPQGTLLSVPTPIKRLVYCWPVQLC